jgi:hypothetical protein
VRQAPDKRRKQRRQFLRVAFRAFNYTNLRCVPSFRLPGQPSTLAPCQPSLPSPGDRLEGLSLSLLIQDRDRLRLQSGGQVTGGGGRLGRAGRETLA